MTTVFVGDRYETLAEIAKHHDPAAVLFEDSAQLCEPANTFYTSIADCGIENLYRVMDRCDVIYYCPPQEGWSDSPRDQRFSIQYWTERYLKFFCQFSNKEIHGFIAMPNVSNPVNNPYLELEDRRQSEDTQLWVCGCSIAHGLGVDDNQRFGQLIADRMQVPVSWLTRPSSSVQWARDQILRSDIRSGDTVVWGVTSSVRFPYYDQRVLHINPQYYHDNREFNTVIPIDKLDDEDQVYQCVTAIRQVDNFCAKIGARLFLLDMFPGTDNPLREYFLTMPNFGAVLNDDVFIDLGTDQQHPGPLQHEMYATAFLSMMEKK